MSGQKKKRKLTASHCARIAESARKRWANMTPEEREIQSRRKFDQMRKGLHVLGNQHLTRNSVPSWVDSDFDEMGA